MYPTNGIEPGDGAPGMEFQSAQRPSMGGMPESGGGIGIEFESRKDSVTLYGIILFR